MSNKININLNILALKSTQTIWSSKNNRLNNDVILREILNINQFNC